MFVILIFSVKQTIIENLILRSYVSYASYVEFIGYDRIESNPVNLCHYIQELICKMVWQVI